MKLRAPAKVNLHLKILGRRPDGYHELETLMVRAGVEDTLEFERSDSPGIQMTCSDPALSCGPENLISRAAALFFSETGLSDGVSIHVEKHIPMGAGLGGGSSNAACTLRGLDQLFSTNLGSAKLEKLAGRIGSDVAWFVRGEPALCRGRGQLLEPVSGTPRWPGVLIKPPFGVFTPWAYQAWGAGAPWNPERQSADGVDFFNDLEPPVFQKYVVLPVIKSWLQKQAGVRVAAMSGSGSTVFGLCDSRASADHLVPMVHEEFGSSFWVQPCEIG